MKFELHKACAAWPVLPSDQLKALADDIKAHGLNHPITLTPDGQLLSGQNRQLACEMAGIEPTTVVYSGDPVRFSLSENKHRRHMDPILLAKVAAKVARLAHGSNRFQKKVESANADSTPTDTPTRLEVIAETGASKTQVESWAAILKDGTPEDEKAVDEGRANLRKMADVVRARKKANRAQPKPAKSAKKPTPLHQATFPRKHKRLVDLDIGDARRPSQPVQLWPVHIQDLFDDGVTVSVAATSIVAFVGRFECTAEQFAAAVDRMLAYQPVPGKDNGEQHDFAADAHKKLTFAETKIHQAIEWLTGIRDVIAKATETKAEPLRASN